MSNTIIVLILLLVAPGGIWLQLFLSRKKSKWLGLILPVICLLFSLVAVMGVASFSTLTTTEQTVLENGRVVDTVIESSTNREDVPSTVLTVVSVFLLYNIPTIVLLVIYFACRESIKRNKELEKMNVQDLE